MTDLDKPVEVIKKFLARAQYATKGPWYIDCDGNAVVGGLPPGERILQSMTKGVPGFNDLFFTVAARDVPIALETVLRHLAELATEAHAFTRHVENCYKIQSASGAMLSHKCSEILESLDPLKDRSTRS